MQRIEFPIRAGAIALATAATLSFSTLTATASAPPQPARNGNCQELEFCLFHNSDHQGSISDFTGSVTDYGDSQPSCYEYKGHGTGQFECVKNDAASVWNRTSQPVTVFFNSGYRGLSQTIPAGGKSNLSPELKNENASHRFEHSGSKPKQYGVPGVNPHPASLSRAPQATARTQFVDDEIARLAGERDCSVGPFRNDPDSDHDTGNAFDCLIPDTWGGTPTPAQRDQGWRLAKWLQSHAEQLRIRYVIWDNRIWSLRRSSEGWREYSGPHQHLDHVHVSVQNAEN